MTKPPPVIGAALRLPELTRFQGWILEKDRDVELQDFVDTKILDGDWSPLAAEARRLLDG